MKNKLQVLPLYGELDVEEQQLAVEDTTSSKLKVVLATNLAETSITLKDCSVVIDVGLIKFKSGYALVTEWASKQNVRQRAGRTGRTRPGVAYFLFQEEVYTSMLDTLPPEMERVPLDKPVLGVIWEGERPVATSIEQALAAKQWAAMPRKQQRKKCLRIFWNQQENLQDRLMDHPGPGQSAMCLSWPQLA